MKTKAILSVCLSALFFVSTKAADLYVNNSGQSGTYTTIQTALNVASSGDRIFVSPYGVYTEDLTISKSITIASSLSGSNVVLNGDITFWPEANDKITIIGVNGVGCNLTNNTITATVNSKAIINFISCYFTSPVNLSHDAIIVNSSFSSFQNLTITYGNTIANQITGTLEYKDGPNTVLNDTNLVIANRIQNSVVFRNDDYYYRISNNKMASLSVYAAVFNSTTENFITNNWFAWARNSTTTGISFVYLNTTDNYSNVVVTGNVMHAINLRGGGYRYNRYLISFSSSAAMTVSSVNSPRVFYNLLLGSKATGDYDYLNLVTHSSVINSVSLTSGYNSLINSRSDLNGFLSGSTLFSFAYPTPDNKNAISNLHQIKDRNSPTTEFHDIDLTRGDIGPWGGPFTWDNYWYGSEESRVINLNLPSEIWPGQTVNLKAEAVHTN